MERTLARRRSILEILPDTARKTSSLPLPHPNHQPQRLPQEPLARLQRLLIQLELVPPEDGGDNERELHLGHVAANAGARAVGEGNES